MKFRSEKYFEKQPILHSQTPSKHERTKQGKKQDKK